ncbi:alpha/beta fold hydrolase [Rhodococcus sp. LB1]|uniref:alpha/beta fold hydrolase n=1 Tax=Rhodococcus sp. LB1 TaxID=1807499 RepID=UPI00077AA9FB|nr:alpha/beta fold hydrolase [Rhodococcus sp. LB1]KXX58863.1 hypothetical protein AZG88_43810 [Rhodococcus sp. LB1]
MPSSTQSPIGPERFDLETPGGIVSVLRSGTGVPALLLHSAGGARAWSPLHEAIAARRTLFAPDHPGFGLSGDFADFTSVNDIVEHYLRVVDLLELDTFDLIGSSFGGWISAELAARAPERVRSLTLLCPAGLDLPEAPVTDLFALTPGEIVRHLFHSPDMIELVLSTPPDEEAAAAAARDMSSLARFASDPVLCDPELRSRLPLVAAPTLVVAAGEDRIIPSRHSEIYAAEIPDARLLVVEGVGHVLDGEKPEPVIDACLEFLFDPLSVAS